MGKAWFFGVAIFGISTATVVANPGGMVSTVVNTVQQQVQNATHPGGTSAGGGPSVGGGCHRH